MSKPTLYYNDASPPSRTCLLTAKALGIDLNYKIVSLEIGEHLTQDFLKLNPSHTIPVLDDNGVIITDSHAIISYLADKYAKDDTWYPKNIVDRAKVNEKLYFDTGFLYCRFRFLVEPIFYHGSPDLSQEKIDYLEETFKLLESILTTSKFIVGDNMTIADFSVISSVSSIEVALPIDKTKYPNLYTYKLHYEALPYYQDANQVGATQLSGFVHGALAENRKKAGK